MIINLFLSKFQTDVRRQSNIKRGGERSMPILGHLETSKKRLISRKEPQKEFLFTNNLKKVTCICVFYKYIIITYDFLQFMAGVSFFGCPLFQTNVRRHRRRCSLW
jgi:hypothetical protein